MVSYPVLRLARRYVIGGRVQGVGFRFFAEEAAARAPGGDVCGEPADAARVEQVEVDESAPTGRNTGFSIR